MERKLLIKNLSVSYPDSKKNYVLNNINLEVNENEVVAIIGKNGAGKTTLFECVLNSLSYKGEIINDFEKEMSIIFQSNFKHFSTAKNYVKLFINLTKSPKIYVNNLLNMLDITHFWNTDIHKLSLGQKQKIKIFISLINQPKLLLLDEMTTALDYKSKKEMQKILKTLFEKEKLTMILISHDIEEIALFATHYCFLENTKLSEKKKFELTYDEKIAFLKNYLFFNNNVESNLLFDSNGEEEIND